MASAATSVLARWPHRRWLLGLLAVSLVLNVCFVAGVAALIWQLRSSGDRLSLRFRPYPRLSVISPAMAVGGDADVSLDEAAHALLENAEKERSAA